MGPIVAARRAIAGLFAVWDASSKWVLCSERLLFQLMDVTGKAFWAITYHRATN